MARLRARTAFFSKVKFIHYRKGHAKPRDREIVEAHILLNDHFVWGDVAGAAVAFFKKIRSQN